MTPSPSVQKYAVLYVDDEEQALKYFGKGLGKDFEVLTAPNVVEAMKILEQRNGSIGLVITDQRMPGQSGVEFLSMVRKKWPAIVRVLVTAYTDIDSAIEAVNSGAIFKYVTKPADFGLLRRILTEGLDLHRETLHRNALEATLRELEAQRQVAQEAEARRAQLQQQLIDASRDAGRAEVATGILHNVGNVLNSVNVSVSVINNALSQSRLGNLCKGLAMIEEHAQDLGTFLTTDERGRVLPSYLAKLGNLLHDEQVMLSNEIASLCRNIQHVAEIVRMQQSFAKKVHVVEMVKPAELMDEAWRVGSSACCPVGVELTRDYAPVPDYRLDKHRVLQILINLVSNALNALSGQQTQTRELTLKIETLEQGDLPLVRFQVIDNGEGIAPEYLTKIFAYGFTTRREGHGFGLHSAANAAREMGGSLSASSEGRGLGATFTLELPMSQNVAEGRSDDAPHSITTDERLMEELTT
jgi:signal transduction histidine kinase